MKRIILIAIAAIAFTTLPSFSSKAPAPPATVIDTHFEITGTFGTFNPCNSEFILMDGTLSIDFHTVINDNRVNQSRHISGHWTGTGNQGNEYVVNESINSHRNFSLPVGGSYTYNDVVTFKVISKGGAPNFVFKRSFKVTVNANGTVTVLDGDISAECRG